MMKRHHGAFEDVAIFVEVARCESFVEASRRLAVPASTVSRAVARLEDEVGVQLLRRTSRRVALTDDGRQLLLRAAGHVEGLEEALASAADRRAEPEGPVRVTAPAYTGATRVARALAAFAAAHPKITVELDATNAVRDLVQDNYDFGIRLGPVRNPDFVARRLWEGRFELFASRAFVKKALAGKKTLDHDALARAPCVVLRPGTVWRFRAPSGEAVEIAPNARFAVDDPRAAVDVARLGVGVALAPSEAVAGDDDELVRLATTFGEPEPRELFAVYPTRRLLQRRVRLAIDWLAKPGRAEPITRRPGGGFE